METENYRREVLAEKGTRLDAAGRALLEEDLRSPCTEEVAVFRAFSKIIREAGKRFVVMDTAPTGTRCCCWMRRAPITASSLAR